MIKLQTRDISKSYEEKTIVKDINIELHDNECVALLGISGVGKTTIFNILSGILKPDTGRIILKKRRFSVL